jgi:hypothetical protein
MMDYDYDYTMRFTNPGYIVHVGCGGDTMSKADLLMNTLGIDGIAVVGNVYFYNMQDMRHFMFYWKASGA